MFSDFLFLNCTYPQILNTTEMQNIIDLINDSQIYDAIDELDDLGIDSPEYQQLKEEKENGAKPDFVRRFKKFVESLDKKEEKKEPTVKITTNVQSQGNNNTIISGVNHGKINIGGSKNKKKDLVKILFMAANPKNTQSLNLNTEYRTLQQEMRQGSKRDDFEWLSPIFAATLPEMMRGLNQQPNIIHFSGHGLKKGLVLEDENAYAQVVTNEMLDLLFKDLKGIVNIVVLNCCYSTAQAEFLSKIGCYVLGYNTPVGDKVAQSFAKGFYLGLSDGKDFLSALNSGRVLAMGEQPKDTLPLSVWKDGLALEL
jgi:hypothetical protein